MHLKEAVAAVKDEVRAVVKGAVRAAAVVKAAWGEEPGGEDRVNGVLGPAVSAPALPVERLFLIVREFLAPI